MVFFTLKENETHHFYSCRISGNFLLLLKECWNDPLPLWKNSKKVMQHISPALPHFYERPLKTQHYQNCIFTSEYIYTSLKTSLSKLCLLKGHFLFRLFLLTFFFTSHFWSSGKSWTNTRNIFSVNICFNGYMNSWNTLWMFWMITFCKHSCTRFYEHLLSSYF